MVTNNSPAVQQQQNKPAPPTTMGIMETINNTPLDKIPELEFVKNKYITNYNTCNPNADGELMYHRNLVFIKQAIASFTSKVDPFSVYACITTMAVYGYSAAPIDDEVYLYPRDGKMFMQRQAGAHVKRLITTGQILSVLKVNLVYEGDHFEVIDGFIPKGGHIEKFQSDKIIAGYIKFMLPNGTEKHFTYRPSHWESWRASSPQPNGANWRFTPPGSPSDYKAFQPKPGFLMSKIISHACQEKSWTPGRTPATVEVFANVITDAGDVDYSEEYQPKQVIASHIPTITEHEDVTDEESFAKTTPAPAQNTITHEDENF